MSSWFRLRTPTSPADPSSWLLIEKGWRVLASDSQEVGRVVAVTGDPGRDIFNGLAFRPPERREARYVPAGNVESIRPGEVTLDLAVSEIELLRDLHQVFPRATFVQRLGHLAHPFRSGER
jgi:hypothetical protein